VTKRLPPSTLLEQAIEELLSEDLADAEKLAELGRLGARLVIQRAVEEEVTGFLGRAHYQRAQEAQGYRNGIRPRRLQTAEGELEIQMPQLRDTAERFVCRTLPDTRTVIRTRPLEALVIGAYVRGLSDRDLESLLLEAGLGKLSKSSASRICQELRDRYRAFRARSLEVELLVLFLDAIYLPTRPSGAKEGVLVAWGYNLEGQRVLLDVSLGQRERLEDWLEMGRGLVRRGLRTPWLVVTDGAPGLLRAIEELWPEAERQRCTVHRLRNVLAKLPQRGGSRSESRPPTGRRWTPPVQLPRRKIACVDWWPTWSASIPVPPPAWPTICRRSAFISTTPSTSASGCGARICSNAPWARSSAGRE
jgi:putative transposase